MNLQEQKPATPWPLILLFLLISAGALVVGIFYITSQRKHLLDDSIKELSSIADLKVRQIMQWQRERIADGSFLSQNISFKRQLSGFISRSGEKELREDLLNDLKILTENYDYRTTIFVDNKSNVRLSYPNQDTVIGDYLKRILPDVLKKGEVLLTDLHMTGKVSFIHLDLLVPFKGPGAKDSAVFGLLVIRIDPQKVLWPLLKSWPGTSKTSETLLFHREGDEIVYLNELRHQNNSEMVLRKPVSEIKLAAVMALHGISKSANAVDYRGVPVVAAMKKVPLSPWYLVAKTDREEIFASFDDRVRMVLIIMILLILTCGSFLIFLWRNQNARFYREKYETELERLALVRHYDYILKYANDIILLVDCDFKIVEANDKALETYQIDRTELLGKNVSELRSDDIPGNLDEDWKTLDQTGSATFETIHKRKDGTTFPIEISARGVDIEGVRYYQSISRDITERKRAEETLRESEEKFRKIFEDSPFCMIMTGKDMGIIRANSAFCHMFGYTEDELLGMTFRNFTHPDHISNDEVSILKLVAGEIPIYHTEKRYIRSDGSIIWGSTTVSIIRNNKGEVHLILAMVEDITSRVIAKAELEKMFSLQKATLESTADGILVVDTKGKIVQYNKKFAEMWGIPEEVLKLREDEAAIKFVLCQLKNPDDFVLQVEQLYSDPEAITYDVLEFLDNRFFERYSQPQKIGGKTAGRVWSFRDITERKKAEAEIIAAKEKAEESDRLKTAFLHNVSHEIRTPMNAILGFSTLLNEPDLAEKDRKLFIDMIFQSGNQLLSIINDIVDLASIESGQMKVNIKEINLNTELRKLSEQYSYKEKPRKITLGLKTPLPERDAEIRIDSIKVIQVLSNLINNAFKFTRKGRIDFGYDLKKGFLEFFVKDTGIGIPSEHHSKIFERFYQVDSTVSRQYTGTGLGLSICKAYVELLGGRIWLSSTADIGTTFYFTIPYVRKEEAI
ncbi:MAG: PAS domain S-box protein [Bacteroidales bacterium]|jgi:PAS domain S-box-containing protein|nr:PAS domain S-box protein [Bacteroidales bacterium]